MAAEPFKARVDINWRYGQERAILMSEFWVPIAQGPDNVLYGDLRMMGDDGQNREGNLGIGYRQLAALPFTGAKGVVGVHGWIDRRFTARGSKFNQLAAGAEWLGESVDLRLNGYLPLSDEEYYTIANPNPQSPSLIGTGIVVDTDATLLEEPQHGFDGEIGIELGQFSPFLRENTDSVRLYGGGYYFDGEHTERVTGWRTRLAADISPNIQIGGRFQRDDERGSQGFLEATFRFPFGHKKSYRREGLRARLDESPERDIDIVTSDTLSDPGSRVPVLNTATGAPQEVLHVDNTAAPGGDGSAESPFNTLAAAQGAASAHTIIYVKPGDGTSAGQNQGVSLTQTGQQLLGTGTAFLYDQGRFTTANGASTSATLIAPATSAPIIGNVNAGGDGVTISADNTAVAGVTIDGSTNHGVFLRNDTGTIFRMITLRDLTAQNNGSTGVWIQADGVASEIDTVKIEEVISRDNGVWGILHYATNGGAIRNVLITGSSATGNLSHGIWVFPTTGASIENVIISDSEAISNTGNGVYLYSSFGGVLDGVTIDGATSRSNQSDGILVFTNVASEMKGVFMSATSSSNNTGNGVRILDNTALEFSLDLGGGSFESTGGNSFFDNIGLDLRVDLDGGELKAEGNWWGDPTGLQPVRVQLDSGSTIDADPFLTSAP